MITSRLLLALALLPAAGWAQTERPILTRAQAIQTATDFCKRIGAPVDGDATTAFPADTGIQWQPCWRINLPEVTVEVVDSTGIVCLYSDSRVGRRLQDLPQGETIAEDEAVLRATYVLAATGQRAELAFSDVSLSEAGSRPSAANRLWTVSWVRHYMGIPYDRLGPSGARVQLNAQTGDVEGLAVVFLTPPPVSADVLVSPDAGATIAFGQLARATILDAVPFRLDLDVVRPNTLWQPGGDETPLPTLPRIAWMCTFCTGDTYPTVYVDAATGVVIGGDRGAPRGRANRVPVSRQLRTAREVRVYRRAKNGTWPAKPLGVLSYRSNAPVFDALKRAGEKSAGTPKTFAEYKVLLLADKKQRDELVYVGKSGLLGTGGGWIAAPLEFRNWLRDADRPRAQP